MSSTPESRIQIQTPEIMEANRTTRAEALARLGSVLAQPGIMDGTTSEAEITRQWLEAVRHDVPVFPSGWYVPPADGLAFMCGFEKVNYGSLREISLDDNNFFGPENPIAYGYSSFVDKNTGVITDGGGIMYIGDDENIKKHLQLAAQLNQEIAASIKVGMPLSAIYQHAAELFDQYEVVNGVIRTDNPADMNIGHTAPNLTAEEIQMVKSGELPWADALQLISKRRLYVNPIEQALVQPGMIFTLEPRLTKLGLTDEKSGAPIMGSRHVTVQVHNNGSVHLLENFGPLDKATGMDRFMPA